MRRRRRPIDTLSLSFLDAISCGFGAVILLLVISKMFEPIRLEESQQELDGLIVKYQDELNDILGETDRIQREQETTEEKVRLDKGQSCRLTTSRAVPSSNASSREFVANIVPSRTTRRSQRNSPVSSMRRSSR